MKAYSLDLRERIVAFVKEGGSVDEAVGQFKVGRRTIYRYLLAHKEKRLAPKTSWGHWRKLDPQKLLEEIRRNPDATLSELGETFNVSLGTIWYRLNKMGVVLKRGHRLPRTSKRAKPD